MRVVLAMGWQIGSRILAGVFASYAFTWGFIAVVSAGRLRAGTEFHEATDLAVMLGFLVYPAAFCFAFVVSSLARVWLALAGGGAGLTLLGWWLSRGLG